MNLKNALLNYFSAWFNNGLAIQRYLRIRAQLKISEMINVILPLSDVFSGLCKPLFSTATLLL